MGSTEMESKFNSSGVFITTEEGLRIDFEDLMNNEKDSSSSRGTMSSFSPSIIENYIKNPSVNRNSKGRDIDALDLQKGRDNLRKLSKTIQNNIEEIPTSFQNISQTKVDVPNASSLWFFSFLKLLSWFIPTEKSELKSQVESFTQMSLSSSQELEEVLNDWEWILSATEEYSRTQSKLESERIINELKNLRQGGHTIKIRKYLSDAGKNILSQLSQAEREDLATPLDNSKRSKIIADVVTAMEEEWFQFIKSKHLVFLQYEHRIKFEESYYEKKPYVKGVVGSMKELAFSASSGTNNTGMNDKVMVDILWSFWKTLTESLKTEGCSIDQNELIQIADQITKSCYTLVSLWIDTVRNSRSGSTREGQLVKKWQKEEIEFRKDQRSKFADARYTRDTYKIPKQNIKDMKMLKRFLEEHLSLTTPTA